MRKVSLILIAGVSGCADFAGQSETVRVDPEPLVAIGELEGAEEYLFSSIRQAFLLGDGRLVVSDRGVNEIRVFGPDGTFLNTIGRVGEGPGEFGDVTGLWLTPDGLIGVWDRETLRLSTFTADGDLVSAGRLRAEEAAEYSVSPEVLFGSFANGDILLASLEFGGPPDTPEAIPDRWVLARFGPDGEPRGALGSLRGMRRLRGMPIPFTPLPRVTILGDSLFAADGYGAAIDVRGPDGAVGRTIALPAVDRSGDADAAWSELEAELRARDLGMYLGMLERLPRSDEFPQIGGLLADDRGLLWVKVYEIPDDALWLGLGAALHPGAGGEWRLVRPDGADGEVQATVRLLDGLIPLHIAGDRLVGIRRDALDVERLVVHALERVSDPGVIRRW